MCFDSTVFLIDDDVAVQDALSISLSMAGLKIEIFPSGKAFLDVYTGDQPQDTVDNSIYGYEII